MLIDKRTTRGVIRNAGELSRRFAISTPRGDADLDRFVYEGYRAGGAGFLDAVSGRFGTAYLDEARGVLFLARDWIGETPLHWLATSHGVIVANALRPLRDAAGSEFQYRYVRAFPQSHFLELDVSGASPDCVAETCRARDDALFYDFAADCRRQMEAALPVDAPLTEGVRWALIESVRSRASPSSRTALLLSGGLDSLSVALMLRGCDIPFVAYTLSVEDGGDDPAMAAQFARHLGVELRIVRVSETDLREAALEVIDIADSYHLFNFYCAVGMHMLGRAISADGVGPVFCGEGVNEALGDYHDWVLSSPRTGKSVVLQRVNYERMSRVSERVLYVWGHSHDRGRYNRQLGTGLAKHASSRMVKPMLWHGLQLESPYLERSVLTRLVTLAPEVLTRIGGKPGLFMKIFGADAKRLGIPEGLISNCKKVRLQDASEGGGGGLSQVLLDAGYDQRWLLERFNSVFHSSLNPDLEARRLSRVTA